MNRETEGTNLQKKKLSPTFKSTCLVDLLSPLNILLAMRIFAQQLNELDFCLFCGHTTNRQEETVKFSSYFFLGFRQNDIDATCNESTHKNF